MVSVDEYRAEIVSLLGTAPPVSLPLADCAGLVLADDVLAGVSLPPFDNSAMDGYAVRAADVAGASAESPVELPVGEDIPAGRVDVPELPPGVTHRIMTGAPMPPGADSVVMVERTDGGTEKVRINEAPEPGAHIRHVGEDVQKGSVALPKGTVLGPAQLGLAAAVGLDRLIVRKPLRVLVVSTGTELVVPPRPLKFGQIYESNSITLAAAIRALGCEAEIAMSIDDVGMFRRAIEPRLGEFDLVVTTGGVSAGAYEVVKDALTGMDVRFQKVAIQPGGPQGNGRWNGIPVVTLPGNPVSVLVSFEVFLRPALLTALGHSNVDRHRVRARLTEGLKSPAGRRQFRRGYYWQREGEVTGEVGPRGGPGSHLLAAFTQANCLIVLPESVADVPQGAEVDVLLF
ncbi:molybdopterin molybdotransferase MoeA [Amycolatopsis acidiphila]|uniref:molybdopterin molybdotransferase MoeA n=1 Tax=Amycolatopsis acidiphila TaxID=715473 RepID=UPI001643EE8F|nr:gephyrin-like molybdotransferase Glp [Amycolatopsis acidiphila]UIJ64087.1 molybdopterin molybdotransferase MoeA [Amycolatopsis acidiphila]